MKIDLSAQNPILPILRSNPTELLVVDANFFIPPDRTRVGARHRYDFPYFQRIWLDPMFDQFSGLAIHEAVLDELVDTALQNYAQEKISGIRGPKLTVLRDSTLSAVEAALRQSKELLIAKYTNYDPMRNNHDDRGEVKTLAHMGVKGFTYFCSRDGKALRLIEEAEALGTSLDDMRVLHFFEGIYLLQQIGRINNTDARNLYKYLYYLTGNDQRENPNWRDFCSLMDNLYA